MCCNSAEIPHFPDVNRLESNQPYTKHKNSCTGDSQIVETGNRNRFDNGCRRYHDERRHNGFQWCERRWPGNDD